MLREAWTSGQTYAEGATLWESGPKAVLKVSPLGSWEAGKGFPEEVALSPT